MVYVGVCLIAGIRLARERQVNLGAAAQRIVVDYVTTEGYVDCIKGRGTIKKMQRYSLSGTPHEVPQASRPRPQGCPNGEDLFVGT